MHKGFAGQVVHTRRYIATEMQELLGPMVTQNFSSSELEMHTVVEHSCMCKEGG